MGGRGATAKGKASKSEHKEEPKKKRRKLTEAEREQKRKERNQAIKDYYQRQKQWAIESVAGSNYEMLTNKYFTFQGYHSNDDVSIITTNISEWRKGFDDYKTYIMGTGNNKAVFIKGYNLTPVYNHYTGQRAYIVRLNRKYFKQYTFKQNHRDWSFDKDHTFDDFVKIAKEQDKRRKHDMDKYYETGDERYRTFGWRLVSED